MNTAEPTDHNQVHHLHQDLPSPSCAVQYEGEPTESSSSSKTFHPHLVQCSMQGNQQNHHHPRPYNHILCSAVSSINVNFLKHYCRLKIILIMPTCGIIYVNYLLPLRLCSRPQITSDFILLPSPASLAAQSPLYDEEDVEWVGKNVMGGLIWAFTLICILFIINCFPPKQIEIT